jgi:hypothetical protein
MKPLLWRGVAAAALAALAGSVAFTIFGLGASGAVPQTGPVAVRTGPQSPPGRFVRGDGLYNGRSKREQLSASVSGALMGVALAGRSLVAGRVRRRLQHVARAAARRHRAVVLEAGHCRRRSPRSAVAARS